VDYTALDKISTKSAPEQPIAPIQEKTKSGSTRTRKADKVNAFISMLTNSGGASSSGSSSEWETVSDESVESWTDNYNDEELEFLEGLDETERKALIDLETEIRESKKT